MKNKVLHFLFLLLCTAGVTNLFAQSFNEGILNYTVNADGTTVTVKLKQGATSSGSLSIPSTVTYNGNTYTVTAIANYAFYNCSGFTGTLTLPNTLVTIGNYAFGSCNHFVGSLTIPNSVTTIGNSAFSYCSSFTGSLTIGMSVSSIGNEAFKNCTGLTSIMVNPESVPTMGTNVFLNVPTDIPVTVPSVSLADYQSASGWSDFTNMHCMETLTVYDGTTTKNTVPAYIFYFDDFTRSQFVIPAGELTEMMGTPISSMTFYTTSSNVPYTTVSPADVYLKEVDYTSISAYEPKSSATIVYSGFFDIESTVNGGKMTINFSTPFTYQGGNLLVGIENTVDVDYKNINFYGQTVNGASISGSNTTSLDNVQPTQRNFIPKTTFGFIPACDPKSLPYAYGFEDPDEFECWTMLNCDDGSTISYSSAYKGQYGFGFHWNYNPPQYLISPKFEGTSGMFVSFFYKNALNDWPETFQVGYSTTTKSPNAFVWGEEVTANDQYTWQLYEKIFPTGTKYVAVKLNSYDKYYLYLDNFNFEPVFSSIFLTDGYWNDGDNWDIGEVPEEGSDVIIQADAVIPEGYTAYAWDVTLDGGSITVEDGGQLWHRTDNLVVTMKKNIVGYGNANNQDHYYLLASPFNENIPVPTAMTSPGCDLYMFDESEPNAEWRNNRDTPIDELVQPYGYLFASPNDLELSLTGSTKMSGSYNLPNVPYYENPNNNFNGWYLLGNFLTCDVYIYRQDDDGEYIPMELMVYNEEGEKVTLSAGPISPMSAFFVKLTETTTIKYYYYPISSARPAGALKGKFTVNSNGDQVRFSQGNLQYIGSASTPYWKFADKQWETLGNNGQGSTSQYVDRDLFGWGTSGYDHGAVCYQPWSTSQANSDYLVYNNRFSNLYNSTGKADWGYNAIRNGGNQENSGWRTLTKDEWTYILTVRNTPSGIRFAMGNVNGVDGLILLPDNWDASTYTLNETNDDYGGFYANTISATDWTTVLETNGAVFLPKTVGREGTSITTDCNYWSSTHSDINNAYCVYFGNNYVGFGNTVNDRSTGNVVRLVNPVNN